MIRILMLAGYVTGFLFSGTAISQVQKEIDLDTQSWAGPDVMKKALLNPSDDQASILNKASGVTASKRQWNHHQDEFIAFVHFGPNTFSGVEWGSGKENTHIFHPKGKVDTDQWCRVFKAAGMKKVVMTVKHHDGFCLWQTRYNDKFGVKAAKWKNGQGDILRSLSASCKKFGLKLGVYLSPADLYQIENKDGLYGNLSQYKPSVIPTAPKSFSVNPTQARKTPNKELPKFKVVADDYNRYFMNQLYELLTEYGPIDEVWFDGAHPKRKGGQKYKKLQWFRMIRVLAPNAVIFGGPDVRWCGNESGRTRKSEWSVLTFQDESTCGEDRPKENIATDDFLAQRDYSVYGKKYRGNFLAYNIAETDVSIRNGWFWRNARSQSVRSADNVFDMYERSVGGNSVFLLNVPPNKHGKIDQEDANCLKEVGRRIRETYTEDLLAKASFFIDRSSDDSNLKPFRWKGQKKELNSLVVHLPQPKRINRVVLQEDIRNVGQRVAAFRVFFQSKDTKSWKELATGTTVGYKKILRFPEQEVSKLKIAIEKSRGVPSLTAWTAHHYAAPIPSVVVKQEKNGSYRLLVPDADLSFQSHSKSLQKQKLRESTKPIFYSLDGSEPTAASHRYKEPISLPSGGQLKASVFARGKRGPITVQPLAMFDRSWKAAESGASENQKRDPPKNTIDRDQKTYWAAVGSNRFPELQFDFGKEVRLGSIRLTSISNPKNGWKQGTSVVNKGIIKVSEDGKSWREVKTFQLGNLVNDPSPRRVYFEKPERVRFVKICPTGTVTGEKIVAFAEVEFFPPIRQK